MTRNQTAGAAPGGAKLCAWSAPVYAKRGIRPPGQVLGPVLARGCVTLLTGPRGAGKSWLALALAHAAARGGTLAGWRAGKAHRAVYVDAASGEALLAARLAALAPEHPASLVLVPGDAQVAGLPDVATQSGRAALDELTADAELVVIDGLAAVVGPGRGVGARWAALSGWLRSLRRRRLAVLLVDTVEPRALAAVADTVLRLERPADGCADADLRCQVRLVACRAGGAVERFELRLKLKRSGATWTRLDDLDHRVLVAWRLHEGEHSTRAIARALGVAPATAWRLVERGEALPPHLRDGCELPALAAAERRAEQHKQAAERRKERRRQAQRQEYARLRAQAQAQAEEDARMAEVAARTDPHPPPSPAGGRRNAAQHSSEPSPAFGRGQGEGSAAAAVPENGSAAIANSPEAVKQAPATIEEVSTEDLLEAFLIRRAWVKREQLPPQDWLAKFAYQDMFYALRNRLTGRGFNKALEAHDARTTRPLSRAERLWRTPQALLPYGG